MPADPLSHLIEFLKKDANGITNICAQLLISIKKFNSKLLFFLAPTVVFIGPPSSGKKSLTKLLQENSGSVLLDRDILIETAPIGLQKEFGKDMNKNVIELIKLIIY